MSSAYEAALDQIHRKTRHLIVAGLTKITVRSVLRDGFASPAFRVRYGARFDQFEGLSLDEASTLVRRWQGAEREKRAAYKRTWGVSCGTRNTETVLAELALILRVVRASGGAGKFGLIVHTVTDRWRTVAAGMVAAE